MADDRSFILVVFLSLLFSLYLYLHSQLQGVLNLALIFSPQRTFAIITLAFIVDLYSCELLLHNSYVYKISV